MAFPQVAATSSVGDLSSSTPEALTLPSGVATGDRLLAFVAFDADSDPMVIIGTGTGWTKRFQQDGQQTAGVQSAIFEKLEADGDDSLTISTTGNASAAEVGVYIVRRYTGHDPAVEAAIADSHGSSANPDAPSLTPSWGAADTLWEWVAAWDNGTRTLTAYPADYTANQATNVGGATSAGCGIAAATRELNASSTDPGTATISTSDNWNAYTIAIKPVGGGDTTAPTLTSPDFTATGATTGTATVSTDEGNGTLFCVITTSATSPSVAQVKAGNDHTGTAAAFAAGSGSGQAVSGTGTQTVNVTGLTASTTYYAHFVHTDAAANDSTVSTDATGDTTDTPDTTAPVLSSPVGTTTGATTATVGATTDEANGTLYGVVTTSATAPSAAQIKAGQDHTGAAAVFDDSQAVSSTGAKTFSATGLTASTAYRAHLIHTDAAANDSNIVTSAEFTTDAVVSSDIRLRPGLYLERGGQAASLTADRWWVFTSDLSAVENTGTALSINSSGQPTIDINSSASYVVGDFVPIGLTVYDEGSDPEDRTVRTFFGWVEAVAQS
jgi:hypothetical protein